MNSGSSIDYASFRYQKPALPHSAHIHNTHTNTHTHTHTTTTSAAAPVVALPTIPTVPTVAETEIIKGNPYMSIY